MSHWDDGQLDGEGAAAAAMVQWAPEMVAPWLMWGALETVTIPLTSAQTQTSTKQLTRISYTRPEGWHWVFFARIVSGPTPPGAGAFSIGAGVSFDVTLGLGRASVTLPNFEGLSWLWYGPNAAPLDQVRWSTQGRRPARSSSDTVDHEISELVAQNIQVQATVTATTNAFPQDALVIEVGSFFAPSSPLKRVKGGWE